MSLVNDMLRDLEARRAGPGERAPRGRDVHLRRRLDVR